MLRLSIVLALLKAAELFFFPQLARAAPLQIITSIEPPFSFLNQQHQLDGYAVDVVRRLQKKVQTKQEIEVFDWPQVYSRLSEQANTLAFPVARTPQREALFHWIMPLSRNRHGLFVPAALKVKAKDIKELSQLGSIAVLRDDYRHQLLISQGISNIAAYNSWPEAIKAVLKGKAMSIFMSGAGLAFFCQKQQLACNQFKLVFTSDVSNSYIALSKKGTSAASAELWLSAGKALLEDKAFHNAARRWVKHYSYKHKQTMHFAVGALNLWRQKHTLDFMALYPQAVPAIYQHPESGEVKGIVPDILTGFSQKYGVEINYSFVNRQYSEMSLYDGLTDAILLSPDWAKQREKVLFSESLFEHRDYLLGVEPFELSLTSLLKQAGRICGRAQYVYPSLQSLFEQGQIVRVDVGSDSEMLNLLRLRRCQYGILNQFTAEWIKYNFSDEVKVFLSGQPLAKTIVSIAMHKDNALLMPSLNRHILQLKQQKELQQIIQRNLKVKLDFPRHSVLPAF